MSYCIGIYVKVDGCGKCVEIAYPAYYKPTYNLGKLFRSCMSWDFKNSEYYRCDYVMKYVEKGIKELEHNSLKYTKLLPSNGWGTMVNAIETLRSIRECILEENEDIPLKCLYLKWE